MYHWHDSQTSINEPWYVILSEELYRDSSAPSEPRMKTYPVPFDAHIMISFGFITGVSRNKLTEILDSHFHAYAGWLTLSADRVSNIWQAMTENRHWSVY